MNKVIDIVFCAVLAYSVVISLLYFEYARPDLKDLRFLNQCEKEVEVISYFGRVPERVFNKGEAIQDLDGRKPLRKITCKVLVFTSRTSLRYYIYIDDQGHVEYVFATYT